MRAGSLVGDRAPRRASTPTSHAPSNRLARDPLDGVVMRGRKRHGPCTVGVVRVRTTRLFLAAACCGALGCSDLLGIDDGIPRTDAGGAFDVAVIDVFAPLHCGSATCNFAALESCCVDDDSGAQACANATTTCSGLYIPCDRSSQCAQDDDAGPVVCCADYETRDAGIVATGVSCIPVADCNAANDRFVLCGGDGGADCPADASCGVSSFSLPSYPVCLGAGVF